MWQSLKLTILQAELRAQEPGSFPAYPGSLLRGVLGHALRAVGCSQGQLGLQPCAGECTKPGSCVVGQLFGGPCAAGEAPISADRSPPFWVTPLRWPIGDYEGGARVRLRLTLAGEARTWLPEVAHALATMGAIGLGADRLPWSMSGLWSEEPNGVLRPITLGDRAMLWDQAREVTANSILQARPHRDGNIHVNFTSPTHLKSGGKLVGDPDAALLFSRLLRRIGGILQHHHGVDFGEFRFGPLIAEAAQIDVKFQRLRSLQYSRYSNRQQRSHPVAGVMGAMTLNHVTEELWPYLAIGEWTHVGKGAAMGQGKYEVTTVAPQVTRSRAVVQQNARPLQPDVASPLRSRLGENRAGQALPS